MHRTKTFRVFGLGLLVALLGVGVSLSPLVLQLEEDIGLSWLFKLRGTITPPAEVVIVAIDRRSSETFGLPNLPRKWPRVLHARLVDALSQRGAAVIGFDIVFSEPRDRDHDIAFANAIRRAQNVVLIEHLKKESLLPGGVAVSDVGGVTLEKRVPPLTILDDAALASAPFPLPKVPVKVSQTWLFKTGAGDMPTLPVAMFQAFTLPDYDNFRDLLMRVSPEAVRGLPESAASIYASQALVDVVQRLRNVFLQQPDLASALRAQMGRLNLAATDEWRLNALIDIYSGAVNRYLNFYGPAHSITTISYSAFLGEGGQVADLDLQGKAVFVGFSDSLQPEQKDAFYTVFTEESGLDVSGVEIAATLFANLLARNAVKELNVIWILGIVILWGALLGVLLRLVAAPLIVPSALSLSMVYLSLSYALFNASVHWLPLVTPLLWQAPLAVVIALLWKYFDVRRERQNIREAFGYHLPKAVVDQLAKSVSSIKTDARPRYGICLATDAGQYTTLSEQTAPADLRLLMNRYYASVFAPVRGEQGVISDVIGDAVLAVWASIYPDARQRRQACRASLGVLRAVDEFNQANPDALLPTRVGVHCGELVLGHVGAMDHYEYRAVGDIVNTATRLEGLNKHLATRVLVSKEVVDSLDDEFVTRALGRFLLVGKRKPLSVYELMGTRADIDDARHACNTLFAEGLAYIDEQQWRDAFDTFQRLVESHPSDGPAKFYLQLCQQYIDDKAPVPWDGIVHISRK